MGCVRFFFEFILALLENYGNLFGKGNGADDKFSDGTFEQKWSWFIVLESVAATLRIPVSKVTNIGVIEFLNWWAYNKEKGDNQLVKIKQQMK